jgi:hypothetical protein
LYSGYFFLDPRFAQLLQIDIVQTKQNKTKQNKTKLKKWVDCEVLSIRKFVFAWTRIQPTRALPWPDGTAGVMSWIIEPLMFSDTPDQIQGQIYESTSQPANQPTSQPTIQRQVKRLDKESIQDQNGLIPETAQTGAHNHPQNFSAKRVTRAHDRCVHTM